MLIVIPTYKRNDCLCWVLQSLVQCRVDKIPEPIRVLVVNNYPPAAAEIARVVGGFSVHTRFEWQILYRDKSLMPVDNWYSAVSDHALPDEVVFLHGDDDIFCPDALIDRYNAILVSKADMLLSRALHRIIFDFDKSSVLIDMSQYLGGCANLDGTTTNITMGDVPSWGPAFLGAHTYRNTIKFQQSLAKSFDWCNSQNFLDWNTRTLMLPYYLPISLLHGGGNVSGLDKVCVFRGGDRKELNTSRFGVRGWNSGFLALAALDVLSNNELLGYRELDNSRREQRKMAIEWFATFYFDDSIDHKALDTLMKRIDMRFGVRDLYGLINGMRLVVSEISGLRVYKLNSRLKSANVMPIKSFLESLVVA